MFADCRRPENSQVKDTLRGKVQHGQMLKEYFFKKSENWENIFEVWHFGRDSCFFPYSNAIRYQGRKSKKVG